MLLSGVKLFSEVKALLISEFLEQMEITRLKNVESLLDLQHNDFILFPKVETTLGS